MQHGSNDGDVMQEIVLPITGMHCGGCVKSVTAVLAALPGVDSVAVSLEAAQARVRYDSRRVAPDAMRQAVIDAGFGVGTQPG
jgi:copper chaperone